MGKPKYLGKKPIPVPLCPLVWDGTRAPRGERSATIHTMAQAKYSIHNKCVCVCVCARARVCSTFSQIISGFHRALLQSITFISRLNSLDYTKLRG